MDPRSPAADDVPTPSVVPASAAAPATTPTVARATLRAGLVYALLFGAQGAYLPYISIYLHSTGLDLGTVGALIALFAAVSLVAAPSWGALADAIGDVRGPILAACLLACAAVFLLAIASGPFALAIGTALLAASFAGVVPMVDSRAVRMVGHRDRFGQARAPGSAAFVVVAFATGAVLGSLGSKGMFVLYGPLVVVTGLAAWFLLRMPATTAGRSTNRGLASGIAGRALAGVSPGTILGVLRTPRLGPFFIASIVVWTSHAALQGFVSLRVVELGGSAAAIAATWSLGAVIEVPLMYAFPALARRFRPERLIVIGGFAFGVRALISALAGDPVQIVAASVFGGVGFSFFYVGSVSWVSGAVGRGVQATAQGIFTGTANSFGAIGGSIVGGAIGGVFGLPALFGLAAAGYAIGAVIAWAAIARRPPDGRPEMLTARSS